MMRSPTFSLDIETRDLTGDQVAFESQFLKAHPSTKDPGKIEKQLADKEKKLIEKGGLTDSCEIASIGIHTRNSLPLVLHTFPFDETLEEEYCVQHRAYQNEREMLYAFYHEMSTACDDETEIIVAGRDFDFPKIRMRCVVNGVPIPSPLYPGAGNPTYDVLFMATRYYLTGKRFSVGLDELSQRLGVDTGDKALSGARVPEMIKEERYKEVIVYNGLDAYKNTECYNKMTCRY